MNRNNKIFLGAAFVFIGTMVLCISKAFSMTPTYTGDLINTAVCVDSTPSINMNLARAQIDYLSFQTIYSSAIFNQSTFTDGRSSTGSITVASNTNFTIRAATDAITISATASLAPVKSTDTITVSSNSVLSGAILTVNGTQLIEGRDWTKQTTATGTARSIRNLLFRFPGISVTTTGAESTVVYTTATLAGLGGNSFTLVSSTPSALVLGSANFTGGRQNGLTNAVLTVNGSQYRNGYLWTSLDAQGIDNSTMTATSLASLLNHISGFSAQALSSVVTSTATTGGSGSNNFTMSSNNSFMSVASANFAGGRDTTTITINGTVLTNGVDWTTGATSSATAKSISDAIAANSSLNTLIRSTWSAASVVTTTSTIIGIVSDYTQASNNSTSITLNAAAMAGGSDASWVVNTPTITITGHGYTLGEGVLYSTGSIAISGLTNQTTYYVTPIDANNIKLSASKALAVSGTYITLASSSTAGQHTYTLTPSTLTGTASWKWQESNDNTNWNDLSVSSVTFASPFTSASTFWDFGNINPHYLRLNFTSPTTGCVNLRAIGNGKSAP